MKILITGGAGMLARTLTRRVRGHDVVPLGADALDVGDARNCEAAFAQYRPDVAIHCAAMTTVDRCESQPDSAFRVNALGSGNVAAACARYRVRLVAISSDYVFKGDLSRPYHEWDAPGPQTTYGASKYAGEQAIRSLCPNHLIVRVAWLYGPGGPSFIHTMLKLGLKQEGPLKVVADQLGNPTSTDAVADALLPILELPLFGTIHLTCSGETSWYGFARSIFSIRKLARPLVPCTTAEFQRPAPRPANSRLEKLAMRLHGLPPMLDWQVALERFLKEFPDG